MKRFWIILIAAILTIALFIRADEPRKRFEVERVVTSEGIFFPKDGVTIEIAYYNDVIEILSNNSTREKFRIDSLDIKEIKGVFFDVYYASHIYSTDTVWAGVPYEFWEVGTASLVNIDGNLGYVLVYCQ